MRESIDVERLIRERGEPVEPSPAFEARLFEALVAKQRALGRGPATPARGETPARPATHGSRRPSVLAILGALAAAAAVLGSALLLPALAPRGMAPSSARMAFAARTIEAPAGEPLRVTLDDGSALFLDRGAVARVEGERAIRLERGRALLEVARAAAPFVVEGPGGTAIARGTKLALDAGAGAGAGGAGGGALEVAVIQGRVALRDRAGREVAIGAGHVARTDALEARRAQRFTHLVSWTRDLVGGAAPLPAANRPPASGEVVAVDPYGQEARLSVRRLHVDVHIEDGVARTTIDTTYFNHLPSRLEGTFRFPVPPGASISRLAMYVEGRLMEGGVAERTHARAVYESIVHARRDPALLEWMEGNVFRMRIFPLEARQEKRVVVSFVQDLESLYGTLRYALPLDAGKEAVRRFSVAVRVAGAAALGETAARSTTYPLVARRDGDDLVLAFEADGHRPRTDLILHLDERPATAAPDVATFAEPDGSRFAIARFRPSLLRGEGTGRVAPAARAPRRHHVVLFDASASRTAPEIAVQRAVLERLLAEWDDGDRFRLIAIHTRARPWRADFEPVRGGDSTAGALAFVDALRPIGATDLTAGFRAAAGALAGVEGGQVVYLGDGVATSGERDPAALAALLPAGVPFVGVAIGKRTDDALLQALAGATGGYAARIEADDSIRWRVLDLVAALGTPRLTRLEATAADALGVPIQGEVTLSRTTAADGEEVRAIVRTDRDRPAAARIVLRGRLDGRPVEMAASLDGARDGASYLPALWARGRVERLIREGAARHQDEIVALGKRYFIATPFTSLLVLETDAMYAEHGVERGRVGGFAPYALPERIEVVTEPLVNVPELAAPAAGERHATWAELERTLASRPPWDEVARRLGEIYLRVDAFTSVHERPQVPALFGTVELGAVETRFNDLDGDALLDLGIDVRGSDFSSPRLNLLSPEPSVTIFVDDIEVNQTGVVPVVNPVVALLQYLRSCDVTLFAPGLYPTAADLRALADRELAGRTPAPIASRHTPFTVRRRLPTGLEEHVYVGEDTIWHVYPELGLAARRPRSVHHEPMVAGLAGTGADVSAETPDLTGLVVVDVPARAVDHVQRRLDQASSDADKAHLDVQLAFSGVRSGYTAAAEAALRRRLGGGDRRLGLYVLFAAVRHWPDEVLRAEGQAVHPASPFFALLRAHQNGDPAVRIARYEQVRREFPGSPFATFARFAAALESVPEAEPLLRDLLAEPAFSDVPWLHERASWHAERQGRLAQAIADLERALELDAAQAGPDGAVDLAAFRARHARLIALHGRLAAALAGTDLAAPATLRAVARVLAAADRWRALDADHVALYAQVARTLLALGAPDEAWEYASTAIERRPAEGEAHVAIARVYAEAGHLRRAVALHAAAAALEPTDPTPLLESARLLERLGEPAAARDLYVTIARGRWHDRFAGVVAQARAALER